MNVAEFKSSVTEDDVLGAVARGWCSPENENKIMDIDLAKAITVEVMKAIEAADTKKMAEMWGRDSAEE